MVSRNDRVCQQVTQIAQRFGIFDCIPCARSLQQFLLEQGIAGRRIQLDTGSQDPLYGRIYDNSVGELIATTGHHEGIVLEVDGVAIVFDNVHPEGIPRDIWIQNFYSPWLDAGEEFQVAEILF